MAHPNEINNTLVIYMYSKTEKLMISPNLQVLFTSCMGVVSARIEPPLYFGQTLHGAQSCITDFLIGG